jgi:hypothetical protein
MSGEPDAGEAVVTAKLEPAASAELVTAPAPVSPGELQAAALTFARALREHIAEGFARGQIETVLSGARCLEHLAGLAGPTVAAAAWTAACRSTQP